MMTHIQPVCDDCWNRTNPGSTPVRMSEPDSERCCMCGVETTSGIYTRIDPKTVTHPKT